jgi:hypothetical protein
LLYTLLSEKFDWSKEDRVPDLVMNEILWQGVKGKPAPSPIRAAFLKRSHKEDRVKLGFTIPVFVK